MPYVRDLAGSSSSRSLSLAGGWVQAPVATGTDTAALQASIDAAAALGVGVVLRGTYTVTALFHTDGFKGFLGFNTATLTGGINFGYILSQAIATPEQVDVVHDNVTFTTPAVLNNRGHLLYTHTSNFQLRNCTFNGAYEWSLLLQAGGAFATTDTPRHLLPLIEGNTFNGGNNTDQVVTLMNTRNAIVRNNIFQGIGSVGTEGYGFNLYQNNHGTLVENNVFQEDDAGMTTATGNRNTTLRGNIFRGRRGLQCAIPSDNAHPTINEYTSDLVIDSNVFDITEAGSPCIILASVNGYTIKDNIFTENNHACVYIRHSYNVSAPAQYPVNGTISGNQFLGNTTSDVGHDGAAPITVYTSVAVSPDLFLTITGNKFKDNKATFTQERAVVFVADVAQEFDEVTISDNVGDTAVEALVAGLSFNRYQNSATAGTNVVRSGNTYA